jgi:glycosyltransferase involved in cell wall biosynthesis
VLVTTPELARTVQAGGGQALVFHEPPASWQEDQPARIAADARPSTGSGRVVCVPFIFTRDEPVDVLVAAARQLPDVEFRVTGNPERLPKEIEIPPNVTLVGFLDSRQFLKELSDSDVVLVLSTEPQSVMRTAYEAIRLGRPLVVSETAATRQYFPFALHTENSGLAVAKAIRALLEEDAGASLQRTRSATEASERITEEQMAELRARIARASSSGS